MASIQQSLNNLFATALGASFAVSQLPAVKNMMAVKEAKESLKSGSEEVKAIYENKDLNFQNRGELLSGVAARQSEEMEKLASLSKSGAEAAKYREKAQYLRQASEGYKKLAQRRAERPERIQARTQALIAERKAANAAQRQADAQKARAEVEQAVEVRKAIIQGLSPERQQELIKEVQNGKE